MGKTIREYEILEKEELDEGLSGSIVNTKMMWGYILGSYNLQKEVDALRKVE